MKLMARTSEILNMRATSAATAEASAARLATLPLVKRRVYSGPMLGTSFTFRPGKSTGSKHPITGPMAWLVVGAGVGVGPMVGTGVGVGPIVGPMVGTGVGGGVGVGPSVGPMARLTCLRSIFPFVSFLLSMSFPFNSDSPSDFVNGLSALFDTFPDRLLCSSSPRIPGLHRNFNNFPTNSACHVALNTRKTTYLREKSTFSLCIGTFPPFASVPEPDLRILPFI